MTKKTAPTPAVETAIVATQPPCLCGCLGLPKRPTSRYLPGHDARHHAAQKKAAAETAPVAAPVADRPRRATKSAAGQGSTTTALPVDSDSAR